MYLSIFVSLQTHVVTSSFCLLQGIFFFSHSVRQFGQTIVPLQSLNRTRTIPIRTITIPPVEFEPGISRFDWTEHSTALYQLQGVDIAFNFHCTWRNALCLLLVCVTGCHVSL